jgi:hypothetical protein
MGMTATPSLIDVELRRARRVRWMTCLHPAVMPIAGAWGARLLHRLRRPCARPRQPERYGIILGTHRT